MFFYPHRVRVLTLSFIFFVFNFSSQKAFAQVDAGALQQQLQKELPIPSPLPLPELQKPEEKKDSVRPKAGEIQFEVKDFILEGVKILPEKDVKAVLKPWTNRPVTLDDLQKACDAIVELYRKAGYTVQAIVPPQKIADGIVKILVTEAKLGRVIIDTPDGPVRFSTQRAAEYITYENQPGKPLNTRDLERALIILNEVPGVVVKSTLEQGEQDGETNVRLLMTPPSQNWLARGELNNYGSRTTGANQAVAGFNYLNPTGIGDSIGLNAIASEGSQYVQGNYSAPVHPSGLRLGVSGTYLNYKNVSNYATNGSTGDAWTTGISAAYPLIRARGTNLNTTLGYDIKSYTNKLMATNQVQSSYNIKNLYLGLSGNHLDGFFGGGITAGSITLTQGYLDIINRGTANNYGTFTPSNFVKTSFSLNRNQQISGDGLTTAYVSISGQLASNDLNSAEQFYLGGPYAVRAYPVAQSPGSQGGLATIELRHQFPQKIMASVFFDAGFVQQYKNINTYNTLKGLTNANNTYSLMGTGVGANWNYEGWNLGAMVAWKVGNNPLYNNSGQAVNTDSTTTNPRAWVTASYLF